MQTWPDKTILVAEDEPINYMLINKILEATGAKVVWVKNGQEAVEQHLQLKPDMILMDLRMPIMDGISAIRKIREEDKTTPIIAVTAFNLGNEADESMEAGCNDFLTKPVMPNTLLTLIETHFS